MITKTVYVMFLIVIASGLHISRHSYIPLSPPNQSPTIPLSHMQQSFSQQGVIQSHLDMLSNQLSMLQHSYLQISKMDKIQVIDNTGTIITCKNISSTDQTNLYYTFQHFETDLWSTYFEIEKFNDKGGQSDLLEKQYQQIKQRKQKLEIKSINFCPQVQTTIAVTEIKKQDNSFADISDNKVISNLAANQNWTYGNITKGQYQINLFQFVRDNNVMSCPDEKPFVSNNGSCITCNNSQIFFLDSGICSHCPNSTVFSNQSHKCLDQSNIKCTSNQFFNNDSQICQCPSGTPYFNGVDCVGCLIPKYWNRKTKSCEQCNSGSYYSIVNGSCLQCSDQNNFVSSLSSCHDQCTLEKPDYDGKMCLKCPQIFNSQTKKCQSCQKDFYYNQDKGICEQKEINIHPSVNCSKGYIFNIENGQCIKQPPCYCPSNYVYNVSTTKCQCPQNFPYDTGVKCISCQAPSTFDSFLKQCIEESFIEPQLIDKVPVINVQNITENITQNITEDITENITENNTENATQDKTKNTTQNTIQNITQNTIQDTTIQQCEDGQVWNNISKTCDCRTQTPYRTLGGQCIHCLPPNQWSESLRQCLPPAPTCKSNFIFDPSTQSCICPKSKPFSNGKQCKQCYLPMYWSYTQKNCKYCPTNEYFNPLSRTCEFCPSERPLLVNHICQACQRGTRYNKQSYNCQSITCYDDAVYSQQINDCYCSDSLRPFYNGRQCVSCMPPNRWDIISRLCVNDNYITYQQQQPSNTSTTLQQ